MFSISSFTSPLRSKWGLRLLAFGGPVVLAIAGLSATKGLIETTGLVWQTLLVAVLGLLGLTAGVVLYLFALRPTRAGVLRWVGGWSLEDRVWWSLLVVALPTVAFASVSALLVHQGLLGTDGVSNEDPQLPFRTAERFLWSLADAVPVLKVPQTLNWNPTFKFTTMSGGALLLAYKLLLVLPFAQLAAGLLKTLFGTDPPANESPAGSETPCA